MKKCYKLFFIFVIIFISQQVFSITKLYLDTNYNANYVNYTNLDFNNSTSTDTVNKIYSNLSINLKTLIDNLEFKVEFCSIGEVGKERNLEIINSTSTFFSYRNYPYPNMEFNPWLSQFYVKYNYSTNPFFIPYVKINVDSIILNFTFGRHRKEILEGMVIGDNKIGYDGISFDFEFGKYFYINSFFTRVEKDNFVNKNFDIYNFILGSKFFETINFGLGTTVENNQIESSKKNFYEFFITQTHEKYNYIFEYAIQKGKAQISDFNGSLWLFKGNVFGKNKYLGKSSAGVIWLLSSGGYEHEQFSPKLSKMYDYTQPFGFGEFARANVSNIFPNLPDGYSGIFVLGFNISFSPLNKFVSEVSYYLYSSPYAPSDRPEPSSTEKTLGAKKAIGVEYDFRFKWEVSPYFFVNFCYSIFDPSKNAYPDKQKGDSATKISFSLDTKF